MIAQSRLVLAFVLGTSSVLHLGALTLIWTEPLVEMEGGGPSAEASLGSSFADLAQGIQQPVETVQKVSPSAPPSAHGPADSAALQRIQSPLESAIPTASPDVAAAPASSSVAKPITSAMVPAALEQPALPMRSEAQPIPPDVVVAALPETLATPVSVRPRMPVKRPDPPRVRPAPKLDKPRGNANRNAKAGTQSGNSAKPAQLRQTSKARTQKALGNAEVSNYPGRVMRRISRVPRPRTSARGVAVIRFSIAANGNLASAAVAGSSGSATLDQAALAVVRKAQPFPPPPAGARSRYSIKIKGR